MNKTFIRMLQRKVANAAIGPSTARRMGPKGTIKAARLWLSTARLTRFSQATRSRFDDQLNAATNELKSCLPGSAAQWGVARKLLNIFLRDCNHDRFLCAAYNLARVKGWLEVPLDSHVATALREKDRSLPKWETVIGLEEHDSARYQQFASVLAARKGIDRIDLDLWFWRRPKK